ncbi:MAG: bifunctional adenosylcobinamide kinase/adenosylcobinamide-phosphate guanylyltransferase [Magnetococcales bacterium]|nr:bifunctional adenosylcobinamide kinase/adenosylcobinamide-phosphate guanylyltransferase [Magnetococcales bacterium]
MVTLLKEKKGSGGRIPQIPLFIFQKCATTGWGVIIRNPGNVSAHLILGGARSGKSALATRLAEESGLPVVFIATAQARDAEMAARIARHQAERPSGWTLIEEPVALAQALTTHANPQRFVVVDCLTLWLANLLLAPDHAARFADERHALLETVPRLSGPVVLVSNETGLGVIPMGEINRRFVDESGWLHQDLARSCDRVSLMVAGLPLTLKGSAA